GIAIRLRNMRRTLGLSQKRLAFISGVSQSEIARIEKDPEKLNPSYATIFAIFTALEDYRIKGSGDVQLVKKASEIMHKHVIHVNPDDTAKKALEIMRKNDFSQLPVLNRRMGVVGTVYQKRLISAMLSGRSDALDVPVKTLLEPALPQVDADTPIQKIKPILENWDAILVSHDRKIVGIITIYDIFKIWQQI
ncbi:MAG: CBS domain-containing protein, partial [Candidatus Micrarchaeaceae archaeon]